MLWRGAARLAEVPRPAARWSIAGGMAAQARALSDRRRLARPDRRLTNWAVMAKVVRGRHAAAQGRLVAARPLRGSACRYVQTLQLPYCRRQGADRGDGRNSGNIRCATAIRCRAGRTAASRCSATPRIRCIRSARTAPRRRSSMRAASPTGLRDAEHPRAGAVGLRAGAAADDRADRDDEPQGRARKA